MVIFKKNLKFDKIGLGSLQLLAIQIHIIIICLFHFVKISLLQRDNDSNKAKYICPAN